MMKARYDRAAIMRDAHKRFGDGKRLGLGWLGVACRRRGKLRRYGEMWRESVHGELVPATATAVWQAEYKPHPVRSFYSNQWDG